MYYLGFRAYLHKNSEKIIRYVPGIISKVNVEISRPQILVLVESQPRYKHLLRDLMQIAKTFAVKIGNISADKPEYDETCHILVGDARGFEQAFLMEKNNNQQATNHVSMLIIDEAQEISVKSGIEVKYVTHIANQLRLYVSITPSFLL